MRIRRTPRRVFGIAGCVALVLSVTGCDYWPPTLQAHIEELQSEIQTVTAENMQLQSQITELSTARQDLQIQFDELNRVNHEKSQMIADLRRQVDFLRTKPVKTKAHAKKTARPSAKSSSTRTVKKTPTTKR